MAQEKRWWNVIKTMLMNITGFSQISMVAFLSEDYEHELFTVTHMTVTILLLLYQAMFGPPLKRPKKDSLADTITNAATAITEAICPSTSVVQECQNPSVNQPAVVIFPGKSIDLRMKNLQKGSSY